MKEKAWSRKTLALLLAAFLMVAGIPETPAFAADTGSVIYQNTFEGAASTGATDDNNQIFGTVTQLEGSNAMEFSKTFDVANTWDSMDINWALSSPYEKATEAGAVAAFDITLPAGAANFAGSMKYKAAVKTAAGWTWLDSGNIGELTKDSFSATADGNYITAKASVAFKDAIPADVRDFTLQLVGAGCGYSGNIYLDNIKLTAPSSSGGGLPAVTPIVSTFGTGADGWSYEGAWPTRTADNTPTVSCDAANGLLKIGPAKFDSAQSWDEIKLKWSRSIASLYGYNDFSFDLYYNPNAYTTGSFKAKLYIKGDVTNGRTDQELVNLYPDISTDHAADVTINGTAYKKVTVGVAFTTANASVTYFSLSVVGSSTDYNGDIYLDNTTLDQKTVSDGYVTRTVAATTQSAIDIGTLNIPTSVQLTDANADANTAKLYAYLKGVAASGNVLYGHQNDTHHQVGCGTGGDTLNMVNDLPAVCGIDGLSLTGSELSLTDAEKTAGTTLVDKAANISIAASQKGALVTLSCHMPNFAQVKTKAKVDGKYDYSGYSPNDTSGDVVSRILPGGDLNDVYTGYLDMVAAYGSKLQDQGVSVLFRPFHENNGSWFWWGAAYCSASQFKNLYRYTEEYLRDTKGLHNFLYVYSPSSSFTGEDDYLSRYPGDDYVDVMGFDMYDKDPSAQDSWFTSFDSVMSIVDSLAEKHNKLAAVTETGILCGNSAMLKSGNQDKEWFTKALAAVSKHNMAYFMTWANFSETNFDQPYMVSETRGQELTDDFMNFYNDGQSIFAGQMADYTALSVTNTVDNNPRGYITTPNSYDRVLQPDAVSANVVTGGAANVQVQFVFTNSSGTAVTVDAAAGGGKTYSAQLTQGTLDKMGKSIGRVCLLLNGVMADSIPVLFNMPKAAANPALVEDAEGYYGENSLAAADYSANCGTGCSASVSLSDTELNSGSYGLAFQYSINNSQSSEGYAGIVKNFTANWSNYDALRFWVKPDGKAQKFIIQLNSNGEDFEVNLSNIAATTDAQIVTIPFSRFVGKNKGTFDASKIQHFAVYCNTLGPKGTVDVTSAMYFDDIQAVNIGSSSGGSSSGSSGGASVPVRVADSAAGGGAAANQPGAPETSAQRAARLEAAGQGRTFVSDTTENLAVAGSYTFKVTSKDGKVPSLVLGSQGVFEVALISHSGSDYFYRLTATGDAGDSTGVYVNGGARLLVATVKPDFNSDTTGRVPVSAGGTYQLMVTAYSEPRFVTGTVGVFRVTYVGRRGNDYFYKLTATGSAGDSTGIYINGSRTPVAVATISK